VQDIFWRIGHTFPTGRFAARPEALAHITPHIVSIISDGAAKGIYRSDNEQTLVHLPGMMQAAAIRIARETGQLLPIQSELLRIVDLALRAPGDHAALA
jgi:hypothetical protein